MFLANSDFRKGWGNVGPFFWLNWIARNAVNDCTKSGTSKAKLISEPDQSHGVARVHVKDLTAIVRVFYDFSTNDTTCLLRQIN